MRDKRMKLLSELKALSPQVPRNDGPSQSDMYAGEQYPAASDVTFAHPLRAAIVESHSTPSPFGAFSARTFLLSMHCCS